MHSIEDIQCVVLCSEVGSGVQGVTRQRNQLDILIRDAS